MKYQVIARKFRPQVFEDVVGQDPIVQTLRNAIGMGRIGHAYLFSGPRGVGKTTMARLLAKALNCAAGPTVTPCNECASCTEIATSGSIDVLEIDAASNTGVDSIRELRENARYAPSRDRLKIFIIDEVHMLSTSAFNALLKTLEEPPEHIAFIMATTERHKLPATILSRCQQFVFRSIPPAEIQSHLQSIAEREGIRVGEGALEYVVKAAGGSMRDAQSLLDQIIAFGGQDVSDEDVRNVLGFVPAQLLDDTLAALAARDAARLLGVVEQVAVQGLNLQQFVRELLAEIRSLLFARLGLDDKIMGSPDDKARIQSRAADFSEQDLIRFFDVLIQLESDLRWTSEPRFQLEVGCIKLTQLGRLRDLEDVIRELGGGRPDEEAPVPAGPARSGQRGSPSENPSQRDPGAAKLQGSADAGPRIQAPESAAAEPGPRAARRAPKAALRVAAASGRRAAQATASSGKPPEAALPGVPDVAGLGSAPAGGDLDSPGDDAVQPAVTDRNPGGDAGAIRSGATTGVADRLREAASAEPAVQRFLDVFRGEIAHVRSTKPDEPEETQ